MAEIPTFVPISVESQQHKPAEHFDLLSPFEFLEDFKIEATGAKQRIWVQVMEYQHGEIVGAFHKELLNGAQRGLHVHLAVDWYNRLTHNGHFNSLALPFKKNELYIAKQQDNHFVDELRDAGAYVIHVNRPANFIDEKVPVRGRNHTKIVIVDNIAYVGGMNLTDSNFRSFDFMVKISDPEMVQALSEQIFRVNDNRRTQDYSRTFSDGETSMMVDCGTKGESGILDEALEMINTEQEQAIYVSQLIPDGDIRTSLRRARERGVKVEGITSEITNHPVVFRELNLASLATMIVKGETFPIKQYPSTLHAKLLWTPKGVYFGSHNLNQSGVEAGTEEVGFFSKNEKLIKNFRAVCETLTQRSRPLFD